MRKCVVVDLVYVEEIKNNDNKEITKTNVKAYETGISNNRYYENLGRGMKLLSNLYIRKYYSNLVPNAKLRYIIIDNKRYKISVFTEIKGVYLSLQIGELV